MTFKPGQSGNPRGRPKETSLTAYARLLVKQADRRKKIVKAWLNKAESGDLKALEMLLERLDGKVKDTLAVEGIAPIVIMSNIPDIEGDIPPVDDITRD